MPEIQWSTLICDTDEKGQSTGRISLHRLRKLLALVAFLFGVGVAVIATLLEVFTGVSVPITMVGMLLGVCVVPITGGQISDAVFGSRISGKIQAGEAPGRRGSDQHDRTQG